MAIRFSEEEVRPMGLVAAGVNGIKLQKNDTVVGMEIMPTRGEVLFVSSTGLGKRVKADQFPMQGRYGQGVIAWKMPKNSKLVGIAAGRGTTRLTLRMFKLAPKVMRIDEAPLLGRQAQGKVIQEVKSKDEVLEVNTYWEVPRPVIKEENSSKPTRATRETSIKPGGKKRPASEGTNSRDGHLEEKIATRRQVSDNRPKEEPTAQPKTGKRQPKNKIS
jgi:DNA gyrase subunit A